MKELKKNIINQQETEKKVLRQNIKKMEIKGQNEKLIRTLLRQLHYEIR